MFEDYFKCDKCGSFTVESMKEAKTSEDVHYCPYCGGDAYMITPEEAQAEKDW